MSLDTLDFAGRDFDKVQNLRSALAVLVQDIRSMQRRFMPGLELGDSETDVGGCPEDSCIFLPSDLANDRRMQSCSKELVTSEVQLRTAAAFEALEDVRSHLRTRSTLINFKSTNMHGYKDSTRSATTFKRLRVLVHIAAETYRAHRAALMILQDPGDWMHDLQRLDQKDLRGLNTNDRPTTHAQEVLDMLKILAPSTHPGVDDELDSDTEAQVEEIGLLTGAVNHSQQRRKVPWIWMGANLQPGEDSGDPEGIDFHTFK
jgi:hypothetical protein